MNNNFSKKFLFLGIFLIILGVMSSELVLVKFLPFLKENLYLARRVLLLLFNFSLIVPGILMIKFRKEGKKLLFSEISFFLFLVVLVVGSEFLVRALTPFSKISLLFSEYPYLRNPYVGLIHKPNFEGEFKSKEFDTHFKTNSEGFRSSEEFIDDSEDKKIVAVLGDSFVEALHVKEEDTFVKVLQEQLKDDGISQVQNYGVVSTGIVHYLQMYKYYAKKHHPQIVVISVFGQNDVENSSPKLEVNDAVRPKYSFDSDGKVEDILPFENPDPTVFSLLHRLDQIFEPFAAYQFLRTLQAKLGRESAKLPSYTYLYEEPWNEDYEQAYQYSSWAFNRLIEEIRNDSALPLVVLVPARQETSDELWTRLEKEYQDFGGPNKLDRNKARLIIEKLAKENNVEFLDLTDIFKDSFNRGEQPYFLIDGHFNPLGHRLAGQAIAEKLNNVSSGGVFNPTARRPEE